MNDDTAPVGPDFALGVPVSDIPDDGCLAGHVGKKEVLLVRRGEEFLAVDAHCTHYHGPLAEGILVGDTVRCPWHHARFDLRTGEAIGPPALSPLGCWDVDHSDGKVYVRRRRPSAGPEPRRKRPRRTDPERIVIIGGGAAGFAAAEMLRREQYRGGLVMLSADSAPPVDRPNLSKDYLAGSAPEDWLPLRPETFYSENDVDLRLDAKVVDIDARSRDVALGDGSSIGYDRLLLATGAEPRRLSVPGSDRLPVLTLRSVADCRTIIRHAQGARRAVVVGASFIGLEVAAALRARDIEVHVVAPEKRPMEHILGPQMGEFIRALHEEHGVVFHLEDKVSLIDGLQVRLGSGHSLSADFVVAGVGV